MTVRTRVQRGEYRDSVALMLLARELEALPGVIQAFAVMGTPANKAILSESGLLSDDAQAARPNDLVVSIQAGDAATADAALDRASGLLSRKAETAASNRPGASHPRSVRAAVRAAPESNIAVISVPGAYASGPAWDALRAGLHVLLFSDHVPLADELALKQHAREHGLLVMGAGAGTAIINGVGLGFANAVPRGPVGIVAAAGTGLQEVSALLAKAGIGITQGIGVGGRDVSEAVGGIMMLEALAALQADPETRVIVIVSKLPAPSVTNRIFAQVARSDKPTVLALMRSPIEAPGEIRLLPHSYLASDLREASALAAALARVGAGPKPAPAIRVVDEARAKLAAEDRAIRRQARTLARKLGPRQRFLRGLYAGGTLCEETMRIWYSMLGPVWSNAPFEEKHKLADSNKSKRHTVVDLGEEEFTIGRPHPMIDNTLRIHRLLQEARDPTVAAIVLDVVIGYGAHPDPASELGPAIAEARDQARKHSRKVIVITSVTGTDADPQQLARQTVELKKAGAIVMPSNAAAAKAAAWTVEQVR